MENAPRNNALRMVVANTKRGNWATFEFAVACDKDKAD